MGQAKNFPPCLQLIAAFSRYDRTLDWLWENVRSRLGAIAVLSSRFDFAESEYYRTTMGDCLKKQFAILECWYDPASLADSKLLSNDWENQISSEGSYSEARPLNIDPGYMSMTKLVLASTKNREHRIYLRDGIYAEVTLAYRNQLWQPMPWTYPDYQRDDFRLFFQQARAYLADRVLEQSRDAANKSVTKVK